MDDFEKIKEDILIEFAQLTRKAINAAKEKDVEPEMLNAIRENLKFFLTYYRGDFS